MSAYEFELEDKLEPEPDLPLGLPMGRSRWSGYKVADMFPFDNDQRWEQLGLHARTMKLEFATIVAPDGSTVAFGGKEEARIKAYLLSPERLTPIFDPTAEGQQTRPYIPGLWIHGTCPGFVGPKGWGKTKFLCQLVAALIIEGRRFLDFFDPAEMTDEERQRDVWLIIPETRPSAIHEELVAAGLEFGYRDGVPCYFDPRYGPDERGVLIVEHIQGRASKFDLRDPEKADEWALKFIAFANRRLPPLSLIVDGITAILGNDTARYGEFTSALKAVMVEAEIPNGLGILHSPMSRNVDTPMNGIESMAEWDGIWYASADRFPIEPADKRYFRTLPRLGDPEVPRRRIILRPDGMLSLLDLISNPGVASRSGVDPAREALIARLAEVGDWMWTKDACGAGDNYGPNKKLLEALEKEGVVISRQQSEGSVRGYQWKLSD